MKNNLSFHLHKNRSLSLPYFLNFFLLLLFLFGLIISVPEENFLTRTLSTLSRSPFSLTDHTLLLKFYQENKAWEKLSEEISIFNFLQNLPSVFQPVLGSNNTNVLGILDQHNQNLNQQKLFWQKMVTEMPQNRDAWLYLSILAYNQKEKDDARAFFEKVLVLDPNFFLLNPQYQVLLEE